MALSSTSQLGAELRQTYRQVFETPDGRIVLAHLEHIFHHSVSLELAARHNNALELAFHSGRADVVLYIQRILKEGFEDEEEEVNYGGPGE